METEILPCVKAQRTTPEHEIFAQEGDAEGSIGCYLIGRGDRVPSVFDDGIEFQVHAVEGIFTRAMVCGNEF